MSQQERKTGRDFKEDYSSFQVGAKRFDDAMQGIADRVPVFAQMHEFTMEALSIPASVFYTTPEILVPATLEIAERYEFDAGFVDYDVYNIEAEALGQKVIFFEHDMPDVDRSSPLIAGPDDLDKIKTPNFKAEGRFPIIMEMNSVYAKLTGLPPALQFCAPFSLAANIRGLENLIMDILRNPEFARNLFDRLVNEVLAPWILYQKEQFPEATSIAGADAMASVPVVNVQILKDWVVPYILRLREICGPELYVPNWVGERYLKQPEEMLALKLKVSPGFLEGQDPDVNKLGPRLYRAYADEHKVPLILGVGARFLAQASPEEVHKRVMHYIDAGAKNGRFSLYLCNLAANTPPENVIAAVDAVKNWG